MSDFVILSVYEDHEETNRNLAKAALVLKEEDVVVFPTETVYGLGANAFSDKATKKIFDLKGRPSNNPLIVHASSKEHCEKIIGRKLEKSELALANSFWPGPLSIIFRDTKKSFSFRKSRNTKRTAFGLSKNVTCGLGTAAIRVPSEKAARCLIKAAGFPLAAPSANKSGRPSPTSAQHVMDDFQNEIKVYLDGGKCRIGLESTVVAVNSENGRETVRILREGGCTKEMIEECVGKFGVAVCAPEKRMAARLKENESPICPGQKYKHYSPETALKLIKGSEDHFVSILRKALNGGQKIGVICSDEILQKVTSLNLEVETISFGKRANLAKMAHLLYDSLRKLDRMNLDIIFAEYCSEEGIGSAILNRLIKASEDNVL